MRFERHLNSPFPPVMKMDAKEEVSSIRIITVTADGRDCAFSAFGDKLSNLPPDGFVAIDTEFSGLGGDSEMKNDNLQTRYLALRRIAHKRALFSVGVSIFNPTSTVSPDPDVASPTMSYNVANFDFLLSCQSPYEMAPTAGSFLAAHGFDFNRMFCSGIPYHRASQEISENKNPEQLTTGADTDAIKKLLTAATTPRTTVRLSGVAGQEGRHPGGLPYGLLWRIGRQGVPIIVHNGLLDLVFLYAALEGTLPPSLNDFVGLLLDCVPCGFWDSKVLATEASQRATYLSYLFASSVLLGRISVQNAQSLPASFQADPPILINRPVSDSVCALFAFRGFCPRGIACPFAHDAFKVVEEERSGRALFDAKEAYKKYREQSKAWKHQKTKSGVSKKQRKRLQAEMNANGAIAEAGDSVNNTTNKMVNNSSCETSEDHNRKVHTAGWDAFCTGYIFASFRATLPSELLLKHHNYIALPDRLSNLLIRKSEYAELDGNTES